MIEVRPPALAGQFYPAGAAALAAELQDLLEASPEEPIGPGFPKMLVAPHAGYIYSGGIAAEAYDLWQPARGVARRVVILCPCHRVPVPGMALSGARAFATPLGRLPVDLEAQSAIADLPGVVEMPAAHEREHAIEVHLPFIQKVLGEVAIVPVVVGGARPETVAEAIERLWGGAETLFLISTDLSHFHSYEDARRIDAATIAAVLRGEAALDSHQACGAIPLAGAILAARRRGLRPELIAACNSGDTAGGRDRVVGYAAFAMAPEGGLTQPYSAAQGERMLALAREAIGAGLGLHPAPRPPDEPWLREHRASFVTIKLEGALRGCIGSIEPGRALGEDVIANAQAAAFRDPRFAALTGADFARLDIEISVLSRAKRLDFADHADLLRQLVPGRDGLVLEWGGTPGAPARRGTFLPQVWEQLPAPEGFVDQLKRKAGLPEGTPTGSCRVRRYRVARFSAPVIAPRPGVN